MIRRPHSKEMRCCHFLISMTKPSENTKKILGPFAKGLKKPPPAAPLSRKGRRDVGEVEAIQEKIARLTRERDEARTALAESECKRVEEAAKATGLIAFREAVYRVAGPRPPDWYGDEPVWNVDLFEVERIVNRFSATPTQETPHVES